MTTSNGLTRSKVCKKCSTDKPIDAFSKDVRTPDGYAKTCADCKRATNTGGRGKKRSGGGKAVKVKKDTAPEPIVLDGLSLEVAAGYGFRASAEDGRLVLEQDCEDGSSATVVLSRTEFKVLAAQFGPWSEA